MSSLSIILLLFPLGQVADDGLPTAVEVRRSVERSLPYMMKEGMNWKAGKKCISCHHVPLAVWTHCEAKAQGMAVDEENLRLLSDGMIDFSAAKKYPDELVDGFLDTVLLASEHASPSPARREALESFQQLLANQQLEDGSWLRRDGHNEPGFSIIPPAAKDDERAQREAREVDTLWALLGLNALERLGKPPSAPVRESLAKQRTSALAFLQDAKESTRNDWLAFRIVLSHDLGENGAIGTWRQALVAQQNEDGGWGLMRGDPSHPLVTGQALYALGTAGIGGDQKTVGRAWKYLLMTQRADGAWSASSRAIANHRNYVTDNFGAGWATLGLLRTLSGHDKQDPGGSTGD